MIVDDSYQSCKEYYVVRISVPDDGRSYHPKEACYEGQRDV